MLFPLIQARPKLRSREASTIQAWELVSIPGLPEAHLAELIPLPNCSAESLKVANRMQPSAITKPILPTPLHDSNQLFQMLSWCAPKFLFNWSDGTLSLLSLLPLPAISVPCKLDGANCFTAGPRCREEFVYERGSPKALRSDARAREIGLVFIEDMFCEDPLICLFPETFFSPLKKLACREQEINLSNLVPLFL